MPGKIFNSSVENPTISSSFPTKTAGQDAQNRSAEPCSKHLNLFASVTRSSKVLTPRYC